MRLGQRALSVLVGTIIKAVMLLEVSGFAAELPVPASMIPGALSLEEAIAGRRSVSSCSDQAIQLDRIGQLLWAAQGLTDPNRGLRAALFSRSSVSG